MSKKPLNQILGHADESDGIEEYDNPLPNWWLGMFYLTIAWGAVYGVHYHFSADRSQVKELAAEMAEAKARWPNAGGERAVALTAANIDAGRTIFAQNCKACHGAELQGGIGPNLKDAEWLHGGKAAEIVHTITAGVAAKGMPAWGPVLGPEKVAQVAAYIVSQGPGAAAQ